MKVADFDRVVAFYTEGLGFEKVMSWGEGDSSAVMLATGNNNHLELFAGGKKAENDEGAFLHLAFKSHSCDNDFNSAISAGAIATKEPTNVDIPSNPVKKVRIAFCKGLNGEILEFFEERE